MLGLHSNHSFTIPAKLSKPLKKKLEISQLREDLMYCLVHLNASFYHLILIKLLIYPVIGGTASNWAKKIMWLERRVKNVRSLADEVEKLEKLEFLSVWYQIPEIKWSSNILQERFWLCSV